MVSYVSMSTRQKGLRTVCTFLHVPALAIELAKPELEPWQKPPSYEKLVGYLAGAYSRRINIQLRLVYQILETEKVVKVLRLWTHYD